MVKLLFAFLVGWFACIAVGRHRARVNAPAAKVFRMDGTRCR